MQQIQTQTKSTMRINWLKQRMLFDFDRIEIINSSDEDVERFAAQVGNDMDSFRKLKYKQMRCLVAANCYLSENSWRILRSQFGQVEVAEFSERIERNKLLSGDVRKYGEAEITTPYLQSPLTSDGTHNSASS